MPREKLLRLLFPGLSVQANPVAKDRLFVDGTTLFENERQKPSIDVYLSWISGVMENEGNQEGF
jgi:hypothetical protein